MQIYLQQNGQQTGPYTEEQLLHMVSGSEINPFDLATYDGLGDWKPLCTIINIPSVSSSSEGAQASQMPMPAKTTSIALPTESDSQAQGTGFQVSQLTPYIDRVSHLFRRGCIIGGWVCFALGMIVLVLFSWSFHVHYYLFVAALLLSIEGLFQRRWLGGISLLVATLIVPTVIGFGLLFYRAHKSSGEVSSILQDKPAVISVWDEG